MCAIYLHEIEIVVLHNDAVETGVPVENDEQIVDEADGAEDVGVVSVPLRAVHERPEAVNLDEPEAAEHRVESDGQVEEVERKEAQAVHVKGGRIHVVLSQLRRLRLQHAFLQVARPEVEGNVQRVDQIAKVVETQPHDERVASNFLTNHTQFKIQSNSNEWQINTRSSEPSMDVAH